MFVQLTENHRATKLFELAMKRIYKPDARARESTVFMIELSSGGQCPPYESVAFK